MKQLKTQMTPCFSGSMLEKLFNDDFKFHIEAITLLSGVRMNSGIFLQFAVRT